MFSRLYTIPKKERNPININKYFLNEYNKLNRYIVIRRLYMECNKPANIEEVKDEVSAEANAQCDCVRGDRGRRGDSIRRDRVLDTGGADSSLLFFFLLLVVIVCQSDCDIELETLLWFFLLLWHYLTFAIVETYKKNLLDSLSRFHFLFFSLSNNSISSLSKSISSIKSSAYKVTYLN